MTRRRRFGVLAAPLAVTAVVALGGGSARADGDAVDLLEQSRDVTEQTFAGVVEVRWRDIDGEHVEKVGARSLRGAFVVGTTDDRVVGQGTERWAGGRGAPGWSAQAGEDVPEVDSVWDVDVIGTRRVAGRSAAIIVAKDDDGNVRARFSVDRDRGQLLEREVLDRDGEVVRSVGFVSIVTDDVAPAVPSIPGDSFTAPVAIDTVPVGLVDPDRVAGGYQRLGRYQYPDRVVQLYFDDGLFSVSLFQQLGRLDWETLPSGGEVQQVAGVRTRSYATPEGTVTVWTDGNVVLTCVADGPTETTRAVVSDISGNAPDSDVFDDIADFVLDPFSWE